MGLASSRRQLADLARVSRVKQLQHRDPAALGPEMVSFFTHSVQKRQTKFSRIGESFSHLVPETLADHCTLESFNRGTLTVLVDSASHLYELKQLLLAGLQQQLLLACRSGGLKKIALKPGTFQSFERDSAARKLRSSN